MTKKELIDEVSNIENVTKKTVSQLIDAVFSSITDAMKRGDSLTIQGFGTFSAMAKADRVGRNPKTGEAIIIPAHNVPKFKAGKKLIQSLKS